MVDISRMLNDFFALARVGKQTRREFAQKLSAPGNLSLVFKFLGGVHAGLVETLKHPITC